MPTPSLAPTRWVLYAAHHEPGRYASALRTEVPFGAGSVIERNQDGNDAGELRSFLRGGLRHRRAGSMYSCQGVTIAVVAGITNDREWNSSSSGWDSHPSGRGYTP